jgi:hypothetical protein
LATMEAPSPSTSRWEGDPVVPSVSSSVRRSPFGGYPAHCGRLPRRTFSCQLDISN